MIECTVHVDRTRERATRRAKMQQDDNAIAWLRD